MLLETHLEPLIEYGHCKQQGNICAVEKHTCIVSNQCKRTYKQCALPRNRPVSIEMQLVTKDSSHRHTPYCRIEGKLMMIKLMYTNVVHSLHLSVAKASRHISYCLIMLSLVYTVANYLQNKTEKHHSQYKLEHIQTYASGTDTQHCLKLSLLLV